MALSCRRLATSAVPSRDVLPVCGAGADHDADGAGLARPPGEPPYGRPIMHKHDRGAAVLAWSEIIGIVPSKSEI